MKLHVIISLLYYSLNLAVDFLDNNYCTGKLFDLYEWMFLSFTLNLSMYYIRFCEL